MIRGRSSTNGPQDSFCEWRGDRNEVGPIEATICGPAFAGTSSVHTRLPIMTHPRSESPSATSNTLVLSALTLRQPTPTGEGGPDPIHAVPLRPDLQDDATVEDVLVVGEPFARDQAWTLATRGQARGRSAWKGPPTTTSIEPCSRMPPSTLRIRMTISGIERLLETDVCKPSITLDTASNVHKLVVSTILGVKCLSGW